MMAKAFHFRLATVERLRRQEVDRRRRVLAEVLRDVADKEARLAAVTDQLRDLAMQTREARQTVLLDVASLRSQQYYRGWLADQAIKTQAELRERRDVVVVERNKLAEASKRLKVMEKLRQRQWNRFRSEQDRRERSAADEMSLQWFRRGSLADAAGQEGEDQDFLCRAEQQVGP